MMHTRTCRDLAMLAATWAVVLVVGCAGDERQKPRDRGSAATDEQMPAPAGRGASTADAEAPDRPAARNERHQRNERDQPGERGRHRQRNQQVSSRAQPADANAEVRRFRILVARVESADHRELAQKLASDLPRSDAAITPAGKMQQVRIDAAKVTVEHSDLESWVYYGQYEARSSVDSAGTLQTVFSDDAQQDLAKIKGLLFRTPDGRDARPFVDAHLVPAAATAPPMRSDWLLTNAPPEVAYTLQIGFYIGEDAQRKQAAAEAVAALRAEGVPAYLHHGPSKSLVFVGEFGPTAVLDGDTANPTWAPEVDQFVARYGEAFRYNLQNGRVWNKIVTDPLTGERQRVRQMSFLVRVPRGEYGSGW